MIGFPGISVLIEYFYSNYANHFDRLKSATIPVRLYNSIEKSGQVNEVEGGVMVVQ